MPVTTLSANDVRRAALWSQGFGGVGRARAGVAAQDQVVGVLNDLGAVQLDTISVLARSHELVAYARLGAVPRSSVDAAYWSGSSAFEYWSHAACILPMRMWPYFAFRRRAFARRGWRWHAVPQASVDVVRARLRADGPLTTRELGGAKRSSGWWDWSETKIAIEWLLDVGEVVCTSRRSWRRVYDLAERAIPTELRESPGWTDDEGVHGPADRDCLRTLVAEAGRTLGVGTMTDLADVHRLSVSEVRAAVDETVLTAVQVAGSSEPHWAHPDALDWLARGAPLRTRTTLLSPFDSLIWHRERVERVFGMRHRLEAYVPARDRVHGYFAMPVLHGGQLVARVDPARDGDVLVARRVTFEPAQSQRRVDTAVEGTAAALREAAQWVGAREVRVEQVIPVGWDAALRTATSASSLH